MCFLSLCFCLSLSLHHRCKYRCSFTHLPHPGTLMYEDNLQYLRYIKYMIKMNQNESKWIKMIGDEEMVWILWKLNVHFSTMTIRRLWHQCQLMKPNVLLCGLFIIHKAVPQLRKACECRKCCKGQLELILFYSSTLDSSLHQFGPCTGTLHTRPHYKHSANLQSSRPASQP